MRFLAITPVLTSIREVPPAGWEEGLLFDIWRNLIYADRWRLLLDGFSITLQVSLGGVLLGITLGLLAALMRISRLWPLRWISTVYITVIRGTPLMVQLLIWWFIVFAAVDNGLLVGVIAFGANSGAYACEIFRAGILSVDHGQTEAGRSVGLTRGQNMRLIVLPQAIKNSLPPMVNEFITLFKDTSLLGVIALTDLTRAANIIRGRTFSAFVPLIAIALVYLSVVMILSWLLGILERRLRRSDLR
jgi:His/Glu/Gln/Arg/opine family amino acid ABC transporter permease subunit